MISLPVLADLFGAFDAQTTSGITIALVLAAIWIFVKIIRKIIGIAFFLCLVYIGLHYCGIDLFSLFGK